MFPPSSFYSLILPRVAAERKLTSCSLWRSSLLLAIISCYLMWAITFLAQLHPLIAPRRGDLREEFLE